MSSLHEVIETPTGIRDRLESSPEGLRIEISRTGAEMVSLQKLCGDGTWRRYLYRDGNTSPPESGWANHATVMGYFLHRLWEEKSLYRGRLLSGGTHGFVRHFLFDPPKFDPEKQSLTFSVPSDKIPPGAYPLKVRLDLTYRLEKNAGLEVEFAFTNEDPLEAHVSFGMHPGFAVDDLQEAEVILSPGRYVRHFAPDNFLNGITQEIEHPGGLMPFPKDQLPGSFLLELSGVPERIFELRNPNSGRRIHLDFGTCPYLTIWSDLHNFICIEPCWGLPDCNPPTPFEKKPGIQKIAPGSVLKKTFRLSPDWQNKNL